MKALPFFAFGLLAAALGCKGGDTSSASAPPAAVSFATVQPVLTEKCAGCHGANNPRKGIDLSSYAATMKGGEEGPIVKAGDAKGSVLVQVMRGEPGHPKMPPRGPMASAVQIKAVEDWIQAGAQA